MPRYRTVLIVNGRAHETYRDALTTHDAATQASKGWRSDAKFRSAINRPKYTQYTFGGPRMSDVATVEVYEPGEDEPPF